MRRNEPATIFAHLSGHARNVGDSALRREYLSSLRSTNRSLVIWTGTPKSGYTAGLGLTEHDTEYSKFIRWYLAALNSAWRGHSCIALNAGEYTLSPRYILINLLLLPLCLITRIRRGTVLWLGAAVPEVKLGRTWIYAALARMASLAKWRDIHTPKIMPTSETMPDWAFKVCSGLADSNRDLLTVSLRGDRSKPDLEWVTEVRTTADRLGLKVAVACQVKEDMDLSRDLATALDAIHVGWNSDNHYNQEFQVRSIYRRSALVISDRLHCLIMAATEGAAPAAWGPTASIKIARHLPHLGFTWVSPPASGPSAALRTLSPSVISNLCVETSAIVKRLQDELRAVDLEISRSLRK